MTQGSVDYDYQRAFARNLGLVTEAEQERLRRSHVAVIGAGGVGGAHALSLARLGVGGLRLIDPDTFELVNFNRQLGATLSTVGRPKASTIAAMIREINPGAELSAFDEALSADNVGPVLDGCALVLDGLDFFAVEARVLLARACRERGIPIISSGPIGMSATMHLFTPDGMSFERYFDLRPGMSTLDKLVAFLAGVTPRMSQRTYMDPRYSNFAEQYGPSLGAACLLCAGVAGIEALRVLLGRPGLRPAPYYYQFDAYRRRFYQGYLWGGNRHPLQRLKRWWLKRLLVARAQGLGSSPA